jgi:hypothetical protein
MSVYKLRGWETYSDKEKDHNDYPSKTTCVKTESNAESED